MPYRFARLLIPFLRYIVFYRFRTLAVRPIPPQQALFGGVVRWNTSPQQGVTPGAGLPVLSVPARRR